VSPHARLQLRRFKPLIIARDAAIGGGRIARAAASLSSSPNDRVSTWKDESTTLGIATIAVMISQRRSAYRGSGMFEAITRAGTSASRRAARSACEIMF
jgi:hypothetical protein